MVDFLEIENPDEKSAKNLRKIYCFGQDLSVIDLVHVEIKRKLNKVNSTRLVQFRHKEK